MFRVIVQVQLSAHDVCISIRERERNPTKPIIFSVLPQINYKADYLAYYWAIFIYIKLHIFKITVTLFYFPQKTKQKKQVYMYIISMACAHFQQKTLTALNNLQWKQFLQAIINVSICRYDYWQCTVYDNTLNCNHNIDNEMLTCSLYFPFKLHNAFLLFSFLLASKVIEIASRDSCHYLLFVNGC